MHKGIVQSTAEQLISRRVTGVSFHEYLVVLSLDDDCILNIYDRYILAPRDANEVSEVANVQDNLQSTNMVRLVGDDIVDVDSNPDGTLLMTFSRGDRLTLFNNPMYEAYLLSIRGIEYRV